MFDTTGARSQLSVQPVVMQGNGAHRSVTVVDSDFEPIGPIEPYLAHLVALERSPNTVRAYATSLKLFHAPSAFGVGVTGPAVAIWAPARSKPPAAGSCQAPAGRAACGIGHSGCRCGFWARKLRYSAPKRTQNVDWHPESLANQSFRALYTGPHHLACSSRAPVWSAVNLCWVRPLRLSDLVT